MKNLRTKARVLVICLVFLAAMSPVSLARTGTDKEANQSGSFWIKELNHAPRAIDIEYARNEIIVKFKPYVAEGAIRRMNSKYKTSVKSTLLSGTKVIRIPSDKTVEEMIRIYEGLPDVEYAEPNYVVRAFMVPNDTYYPYQWHLDNDDYGGINMESAWDISTGSGAVVAILDTGVAYEDYGIYCQTPDLAGTTFVDGYDFVNDDAHPNDDNGHGTHIAGTIAQTTNNGYGVAGVAFDCSIMPVKVLDVEGSGFDAWVAEGIYYAANNGTDVISISLGGPNSSKTLEDAVAYAYDHGVTIVAAAGNEYQEGNPVEYPAAYDDYVIAVGATRYDETRAYYSNTGSYLDLVAPGGDTGVDQNGDGYADGVLQETFSDGNPCDFGFWFYQGTSMAVPHVSGMAALLIANGVTGPDNVRTRLANTAEDKGIPGWDEEYGWGLVNATAALAVNDTTLTVATITVSPPTGNVTVGETHQFTATAYDQNDNPMAGVLITWGSTNTSVGTVSPVTTATGADGTAATTFTAVRAGTSTVVANNGSVSDSVSVAVSAVTPTDAITATRDISEQTVTPGETFTVTVVVTVNQTVSAPVLDEDLPSGWTLSEVDSAGATFKSATTEWLWVGSLSAGASQTVIYNVSVPSDAAAGSYTITGNVSASGVTARAVGGESNVTVATTDWNPWDDDGVITTTELQEAVYYWLTDTPINGHVVTTAEIQELVTMWLTS